jgi:hypothetical protein
MFWDEVGRLVVAAGYVLLGCIAAAVLALLVAFVLQVSRQGGRRRRQ